MDLVVVVVVVAFDGIDFCFLVFVCLLVDLFTVDVPSRRWDIDLRGVLLHVELFSTAPQCIGVVW